MPLVVCGHEDGAIRVGDINQDKVVHTLEQAHQDGISSVQFSNSGLNLMTGALDGSLKVWDVRTYKLLSEVKAHDKKYDEGLLCICAHPGLPFAATGGADSLVKVFELYV